MQVLIGLVCALSSAGASAAPDARSIETVKTELAAFVTELNAAAKRKDRAALERLYAPEFKWVHGAGYVDERADVVDTILATDSGPEVPPPNFDPPRELLLLGDVAIVRGPGSSRLAVSLSQVVTYVKREGRWQLLHMQGTLMQPERGSIALDAKVLDTYAGKYERGPGVATVFTRDGATLVMQHPGVPRRVLRPSAENVFFDKVGSEYTFHRDAAGAVVRYTVKLANGREVEGRRTP
jgi:hypothetical protein